MTQAAIHIVDLLARCILGVTDEERREKQDVLINLRLQADLSAGTASDDLAHTVDYRTLKKRILEYVEESQFRLLETLGDRVAALCLESPLVEDVTVRIEKPAALRFARSVAVEIQRSREPW